MNGKSVHRIVSTDSYLDIVASLRCGSLHGEDDLELLGDEVRGGDRPEGRGLINPVWENYGPEQLEEVLSTIQVCTKLNSKQVVGDLLQKTVLLVQLSLPTYLTSPSSVTDLLTM